MRFLVEPWERMSGGAAQQVYLLTGADGVVQAEIWPEIGCNCLRWRVRGAADPIDLLYIVPDWENNPAPNRSGIPILFPFPNRIRGGHFVWNNQEYQLQGNDPGGRNAIHGFACRRPWRVKKTNSAENLATLTAEFQLSVDAPDDLPLWPGDVRLTMRFLLAPDTLSLSATMENPGDQPVPVGLGYHPYFRVPFDPAGEAGACEVTVPAGSMWELRENLPTGRKLVLDAARSLRAPRKFAELVIDDLYTDLDTPSDEIQLNPRGSLRQPGVGSLDVWTTAAFREMVVFTPPTRQSICLEPYTCATDAINLHAQGIDAGLIVLEPGEARTEFVVLRWAGDGAQVIK